MTSKKLLSVLAAALLLFSLVACAPAEEPTDDVTVTDAPVAEEPETEEPAGDPTTEMMTGQEYVIGFSNSFNGNTYRQTMETELFKVADALVESGTLAEYKVAESNGNNATQVTQIESFILDGVDAIIVDPGSSTALNGAIETAVDAGIVVIVINDGPVTTDACYQINFDATAMAEKATSELVALMGGEGNIINVRGMAGVQFDEDFSAGVYNIVDSTDGVEVVGEVYGEWTGSVAQQQIASILPGLDQVDGVVGQGGDGYGAVQAFEAAGMDMPVVIGGNRGNFLNWWAAEKAATGYETFSWASNPWVGAASLYAVVAILDGVEPSEKSMIMDGLYITQDMVDDYAGQADDFVAVGEYDYAWVIENLF